MAAQDLVWEAGMIEKCTMATNDDIMCAVEDLGLQIDDLKNDMNVNFGYMFSAMNENHVETMRALQYQNEILEENANDLKEISLTLDRMETLADLRDAIQMDHGDVFGIIRDIRRRQKHFRDGYSPSSEFAVLSQDR